MRSPNEPSLYGITRENTNRSGKKLWGKNQFNSTFPLALCLYMRDQGISPVAVTSEDGSIGSVTDKWSMSEVIGQESDNSHYLFETSFKPYVDLSRNKIKNIDLVVAHGDHHVRALEVKLTVVPDIATADKDIQGWAPEVVIRPVSSAYAMFGIATCLLNPENADLRSRVMDTLRPAYNDISSSGWGNIEEILGKADDLLATLDDALNLVEHLQSPFLVQPIWRTKGQSSSLSENCFDVFLWSDVSVMRIPIAVQTNPSSGKTVPRTLREVARHVRALYDILTTGDCDYQDVYNGMGLGSQTSKAFSINGKTAILYLKHPRLACPILHRDTLREIVLNEGHLELKPERRFDAAVKSHMKRSMSI